MNDEEDRPLPEDILEAIKREEKSQTKGKLKIFLGMAAGVGKTYAMLEEAQSLKREKVDVVVGIVDTHGREETAQLLNGLKQIKGLAINYRGKDFEELDLDSIIKVKPEIVLVDELAHTNIPGARHSKRWQDVEEILDNGIDVYTTLNVQHIESLKDVVESITGISVRETVPDTIIERAAEIQLIDLSPYELLERLKDGKVYLGEQSSIAIRHFFQKDRLTALREIVLRYTAEKVDQDLRIMAMPGEQFKGWKPREKLLVAVSSSPHSPKLIRATRRLAFNLNAPWIAVHVNDGHTLSEADNNRLDKNLSLARELGAEVITTSDPDIAAGVERIARQRGVTQIILGRPPQNPFYRFFFMDSMLDRLARQCNDIDVHVIRQEKSLTNHRNRLMAFPSHTQIYSYLFACLYVCLFALINWFFLDWMGYKIVGVIFLLGILLLSLFLRKGPIFFASVLYALIWQFFFIPPVGSFKSESNEDTALLLLYFGTAISVGILVDRARENKEMLIKREETAQALYDIVQQIATAPSNSLIFVSVKDRLARLLKGSVEIIIKKIDDGLQLDSPFPLVNDDKEKAAAIWVFDHGKEAGWSTDTLPSAQNLYIPLKGYREAVGVLVYRPSLPKPLTTEEKNFLHTVCQQLAFHVERSFAEERTKQHAQLKQIEKIHRTILDRISKEFESPLRNTQEAVAELKDGLDTKTKSTIYQEVQLIESSSGSLRKILTNINAMAQLSEGLIPINKTLNNIEELINDSCENLKKSMNKHQIVVMIQKGLPLISFDYYLIQMLLYNLICNAVENSPPNSKITIDTKLNNGHLFLAISDEGKGIPEDQLTVIFEKFYRLPEATGPGMGLGLAISKTIAELHNGSLTAENLPEKGARFIFLLPIE